MEKWSLIRDLALALGASSEAVKKWRQRGIPAAWVLRLQSAAQERAADLTADDLTALASGREDREPVLSTTSRGNVA